MENQKKYTDNQPRWMNTPQLMEYLKVSKSTIDRLKRENIIPYSKVMGICRFDRLAIDVWLEDAQVGGIVQSIKPSDKEVRKTELTDDFTKIKGAKDVRS